MKNISNRQRVAYLDVLKAFAIIAVVLYHSRFLTFGYLGVDLFLVINGYLVTKSLNRKLLNYSQINGGGGGYINFEISRIIRLLPPLLLAGAVCMGVGYFTMLPDDYENLSESVVASNVFGNNILSAITTKNYWDVSNDYKPLMHTWYVGLVMQFYIVYPLCYYAARIDKQNPQRTLLSIISILAVLSMLVYFAQENDAQRFYYLPARFFEFAVGGICALLVEKTKDKTPFHAWFVYFCYVCLLILFIINKEIIPARVRLVLVVALSCVLVVSSGTLENKLSGNTVLAKIGAASYSIFIWHQVLLAFYRYTLTCHFTVISYLFYLVSTGLLAWLTYRFIEQPTTSILSTPKGKRTFYMLTIVLFLCVTGFATYIYINAGVVRDIPELYVTKQNKHRGMHAEYCDRGYQYDRPFTTNKLHWFIIGNSFGRDFVNVVLESNIVDSVEISYTSDFKKTKNHERFAKADRVFISTLGLKEELVAEIEIQCLAAGLPRENLVIVGEKNFGECNGQVYAHRGRADYFDQYVEVEDRKQFIEGNQYFSNLYGDRYLDLMSMVCNEEGKVRVFTPDHHFISADNRHFSKGGAVFFAQMIEWKKYLNH